MTYLYLKALHIIFVVTWFAGLFYFPRLLIYDVESRTEDTPVREALLNKFRIMQRRLLFGIIWPSMLLTVILGTSLIIIQNISLSETWLQLKIALVVLLILYHFSLQKFYNKLRKDKVSVSSDFLRIWNEIPTVLLFAIVFLVVMKTAVDMFIGILGIFALIILLLTAIRIYRYIRTGK